eukprot:91592-Chlamydomonas_euryale.AAC.5
MLSNSPPPGVRPAGEERPQDFRNGPRSKRTSVSGAFPDVARARASGRSRTARRARSVIRSSRN